MLQDGNKGRLLLWELFHIMLPSWNTGLRLGNLILSPCTYKECSSREVKLQGEKRSARCLNYYSKCLSWLFWKTPEVAQLQWRNLGCLITQYCHLAAARSFPGLSVTPRLSLTCIFLLNLVMILKCIRVCAGKRHFLHGKPQIWTWKAFQFRDMRTGVVKAFF